MNSSGSSFNSSRNLLNSPRTSNILNMCSQNHNNKNYNSDNDILINVILENCVHEWFPFLKDEHDDIDKGDEKNQHNLNNEINKLKKYYKGVKSSDFPLPRLYKTNRSICNLNEDNEDESIFYNSNSIYMNILNESNTDNVQTNNYFNEFVNHQENKETEGELICDKKKKEEQKSDEKCVNVTNDVNDNISFYDCIGDISSINNNKYDDNNNNNNNDNHNNYDNNNNNNNNIDEDEYVQETFSSREEKTLNTKNQKKENLKHYIDIKDKEYLKKKGDEGVSKEECENMSSEGRRNYSCDNKYDGKRDDFYNDKSDHINHSNFDSSPFWLKNYKNISNYSNNNSNSNSNITHMNNTYNSMSRIESNYSIKDEENKIINTNNKDVNIYNTIDVNVDSTNNVNKVENDIYLDNDNRNINSIIQEIKNEEAKEKDFTMDSYGNMYLRICLKVLKKNVDYFLSPMNLNNEKLVYEKKKIKEILKLYDKLFYSHFKFIPNKIYKEILRPIYTYYQNLKSNMVGGVSTTSFDAKSRNVSISSSCSSFRRDFDIPKKNATCKEDEENKVIQKKNSFSSEYTNLGSFSNIINDMTVKNILQEVDESSDISHLETDYKYIYKDLLKLKSLLLKKRYYKNILFEYQKNFVQINNRCVKTYRDIYPVEKEYKTYTQIKKQTIEVINSININYKKYYSNI
ncbi:hypothetical protein PFAG_01806 [Plasmodium falciparum Santa Lucia]|uniref:Uncharacterized protein n=2 Tax=Plasmodium falciparum TaxID=5833 RepID=A0A024W9T4_PLAFA|nr:hypothetical protein PFTANZ_01941 [Plasmodium falciparum Tanzania (2000708)]EUT87904.1 hypothetical protein PFAG_01806 [Plasmodium falciparum Santa Lucia]